ncbi:MAG: polyphosphate kinase 1 [Verrucomicrobia bacterium]|nr:MAG: polyphosphate kinase 1 [Verrucomicrobiota bacterium]
MAVNTSAKYFNRELSWLEFNHRVLEEARDRKNPLLERLKFFCIVSSNLDEFFEVRVAGIKQQVASGSLERTPDGRTPQETLAAVRERVLRLVRGQDQCWKRELFPALARAGFEIVPRERWTAADHEHLGRFVDEAVRPVVSPLCVDAGHPFPQGRNLELNLVATGAAGHLGGETRLWVLQVPKSLPRLVDLPSRRNRRRFALLGEVIGWGLARLLPGIAIEGAWAFRVTRNSELYFEEKEVVNLLESVQREVHGRLTGAAVRLEVSAGCPERVWRVLLKTHGLEEEDLYRLESPLHPGGLMRLYDEGRVPELRDPPHRPAPSAALPPEEDPFARLREGDVLLHHPYESFEPVLEWLHRAATDPQVIAIKQTLYRTGNDARIGGALMEAAANGKHVTAVVELKARFDEERNIEWARKLEAAGVQVIYGVIGLKVHCKMTLIVRREGGALRRYLHLSTGNYNPQTARLYTDLGLLTARPEFTEDATDVFNLLTGLCAYRPARRFLVAPYDMHRRVLEQIRRETALTRDQGLPGRIIAKMNSLVDTEVIDALYEASQAGVEIDLIVRGICCLRPGVRGLSERIRVRSIVGRFLEHSRVYYFANGGQPVLWIGSADWMPRNFFRRVELLFPVLDGNLRERIREETLELPLRDNVKARELLPDGRYRRVRPKPGESPLNSQEALIAKFRRRPGGWTEEGSPPARLQPRRSPSGPEPLL